VTATEGGSAEGARATSENSVLGTRAGSQSELDRLAPSTKVESDRLFRKFQRVYQDHVAAKESWGGYVCPPDCSYCREFRVVAEWRAAWEDRV
jgi:hypothetical protein